MNSFNNSAQPFDAGNDPGGRFDSKSIDNIPRRRLIRPDVPDLSTLVTSREKVYGTISLIIGIAAYMLSVLLIFGIVLAPFMLLITFITHGFFVGGLRSSSIRISPQQLPELNAIVEEICTALRMPVPVVYVANGEGMLNAFATRLLSRDFVVVYSNILEMAFERGDAEVAFVLAHELAHIKRRHTKFRFLHYPATCVPFLGNAYSRACETTCDRFAAAVCPEGARWGLVALATGSKIYRRISLDALYRQVEEEQGFWTWFHEILSTHPNLVKRIKSLGLNPIPGTGYDGVKQPGGHQLQDLISRLRG